MKLIADSGSTKTDWCLIDNGRIISRSLTKGINPALQEKSVIKEIIFKELLPMLDKTSLVKEICFYGAGCRPLLRPIVIDVLKSCFPSASKIDVEDDLIASARALFGSKEGIVCILGTGSNSSLYDGTLIVKNIPPLGYILGDEGSGAVLGRNFINAIYKGDIPSTLSKEFFQETNLTLEEIIFKVYKEPMPNRFLASFSKFIYKHIDEPTLKNLVEENFKAFFIKNVNNYNRRDLPLGALGSIAYYYKDLFIKVASLEGYKTIKILENPMEGLLQTEGVLS